MTMTNSSAMKEVARRIVATADQSVQLVGHLIGHAEALMTSVSNDGQRVIDDGLGLIDTITTRFDIARNGIKASPKALRVARTLLAISVRYRIELGRSEISQSNERLEALHNECAIAVRDLCIESRGTFLKVGQFLSMRPDLLPPAYIRQLATLRDRVPALPFAEIRDVLEADLGRSALELFAKVDEEPIAAASLAQVHRAMGHDGQHYALKIQVPQAQEQVAADMAILGALALALGDMLPFDSQAILKQLAQSVEQELDYQLEASHCEALAEKLAPLEGIILPAVHSQFSSKRVLAMSWMPGRSLDLALAERTTAERTEILSRLVDCFARQLFQHGYFQADPHSGNFLVQEDGTLVLLDFGCCAVLDDTVRVGYRNLMMALFTGQSDDLHRELQQLGFSNENDDRDAVEDLVSVMLDQLKREGATAQWAADPQAAIQTLIEKARAVPGLQTPDHFVLLGRVLATLGGLLIENSDADVSLPTILANVLADVAKT